MRDKPSRRFGVEPRREASMQKAQRERRLGKTLAFCQAVRETADISYGGDRWNSDDSRSRYESSESGRRCVSGCAVAPLFSAQAYGLLRDQGLVLP